MAPKVETSRSKINVQSETEGRRALEGYIQSEARDESAISKRLAEKGDAHTNTLASPNPKPAASNKHDPNFSPFLFFVFTF